MKADATPDPGGDPEIPQCASRLSTPFGLLAIATGVLVLVGWLLDIPGLKSVLPGFVSMKANTAVGFILAGVSLALLGRPGRRGPARGLLLVCAGATALLGLFDLCESLFGLNLGFDQLLFREPADAVSTLSPGRMAPTAAINFLLLGCALILSDLRRTFVVSQQLVLLVALIAFQSLVAYTYGTPEWIGVGRFTQMAVHTGALFIFLSLGVLLLHPDTGLMRAFTRDTIGGWLLRRMMPIAVGIPCVLVWLRAHGERAGWFDSTFGAALMVVFMVPLLAGLIWWVARSLSRIDAARKMAVHDLQASEIRYRRLFEAAKDAILILDADTGMIVDVNPFLIEMLGYTREAFLGKAVWELGFFKDIVANQSNFAELRDKGYVRYEDLPLETSDGRRIDVEFVSNTYLVANQRVIQCNIRDITIRKAHEREIERLTRLYAVRSQINLAIIRVKSREELLREVCLGTAEFGGFKVVWIGRRDPETQQIMPVARGGSDDGYLDKIKAYADDRPEGRGPIGTCIREGKPCIFNDFLNDPRALPWRETALAHGIRAAASFPIHFMGEVWGVLSVYDAAANVFQAKEVTLLEEAATDISYAMDRLQQEERRINAESALRGSEEFAKRLIASSEDCIQVLDLEGRLLSMSAGGQKRLEIDDITPYLGKTWIYFWKGADCAAAAEAVALARQGKAGRFTGYCETAKGSPKWWDVIATPIQNAQGVVDRLLAVSRDITESRKAVAEREKLQAQITQAQKMESVGRLAGGVAHDFNNLLMGIMGYADLCQSRLAPDHPIQEFLREIIREADRSSKLTHQLLAFARKQTIAPKVLDLNDAIASMLKLLQRLIGEDIAITWRPGAAPWTVKLDPSQIDQILANLTVNARDAIGGVGSIAIETGKATFDQDYCSEHPGSLPGDYVLLTVADTGCGMNQETLAHIFEPFFTTKGVGEGTGLGLATVYGIVKQNDGFINVYSEPGKGTTFRIYLPRFVAKEGIQVATGTKSELPRGTETILLVEDEKSVRVTTHMRLEFLGYTVLVAEAPEEALRLASGHPGVIHLLISDVIMPGMSGRDLSLRLSQLRPTIKCLFISGFTADIIAQRGILDDGVNFMAKPFSRDQLAYKIREVLDA